MDYQTIGASSIKVSRLCLGCMSFGRPSWRPWVLTAQESQQVIRKAIDLGINFFDTANIYSNGESERIVGLAIQRYMKRSEAVIMTKVGLSPGKRTATSQLSKHAILTQVDASLRRLKTEYIDIYLVHRYDYCTPIEETLEALDEVVRAGKVRAIGASSMYAWQFANMLSTSERKSVAKPSIMQLQCNLVYREEEREMIPLCQAEQVGIVAWAPLARGFLARPPGAAPTRRQSVDSVTPTLHGGPADNAIRDVVRDISDERSVPPATIALSWVLHHGSIASATVGASNMAQLDDADRATTLQLSEEEVNRLEKCYLPRAVLDHN